MTLDRPQTLINKGSSISCLVFKRAFLGQVSLKVSLPRFERQNSPKDGQKAVATVRQPINGLARSSAKVLTNLERDRNAAEIPPVLPLKSL